MPLGGDRVRNPQSASVPQRPLADPIDEVAALQARNELQDYALAARSGVTAGAVILRPAVVSNPNNLISDGSFEGATLDPTWSSLGTAPVVSTTQFYDGKQSMAITGPTNAAYYGYDATFGGTLVCNPGDGVFFSGYRYHDSALNGQSSMSVQFYDTNGVLVGAASSPYDTLVASDGWQYMEISAQAPPTAAFYRVSVTHIQTGATILYFDHALLLLTNTLLGPINTSPDQAGPRLKIDQANVEIHTGHHLEETVGSPGYIQASTNTATGQAAVKDVVQLALSSGQMGGTNLASILSLLSGSNDGLIQSAITAVTQLLQLQGALEVTSTSLFDGAVNLKGGLNSSSLVLDVYQPTDINPILSAAGNTANCGAQHTAFTITDRKMAILVLHFVGAATVNNTATSIQHVQSGVLTNTAGGAPATASTFSIPTSCVGTSIDRVICVSGFLSTGVQCSGAFNVLPQLQWSTTVTVGAGGVANLRTFSSTTITLAIPVA